MLPPLSAFFARALAVGPEARFQTSADMQSVLESLADAFGECPAPAWRRQRSIAELDVR
jgi:hypothetical protein